MPVPEMTENRFLAAAPALTALAYPFVLMGFHTEISGNQIALAAILLLVAFVLPLLGFVFALRLAGGTTA
ncbi:MAG TPA: hypothetical protein VGM68_05205, partial [Rhizomicrobium sp.]